MHRPWLSGSHPDTNVLPALAARNSVPSVNPAMLDATPAFACPRFDVETDPATPSFRVTSWSINEAEEPAVDDCSESISGISGDLTPTPRPLPAPPPEFIRTRGPDTVTPLGSTFTK